MDRMTNLSELEALVGRATPGPYDHRSGLVRAIRGDMAVPLFEVRGVYDPTITPPTVRYPDGKVLFKAGSHDARHSYAEHQRGRNGEALAAILTALPHLLSTIRSQEAALVEARSALEPFAKMAASVLRSPRKGFADDYDWATRQDGTKITFGHLRRAASALSKLEGGE